MRNRTIAVLFSVLLLFVWTGCSGGGDPSTPSDNGTSTGLEAPDFTLPAPPRSSDDAYEIPADPDHAIELNPEGEAVAGKFTFGGTAVRGIEVRIDGEIAAFTDENGDFEIPAILGDDHTISFSILGEVFYSQEYNPYARYAQDDPPIGLGTMAGAVYDSDGPVSGALVVVAKGDTYAYAFTGQYGQYFVAGAPVGNALAAVVAEFHDPVFEAVSIPSDGNPLEKDFFLPQNLTMGRIYGRVVSPEIPGAVPHAYVEYTAPGVFRADLSNIFGIFELEEIPVGDGVVRAEREYFYPVQGGLHVNPGINPIGVIMHLIEQSMMHGYVVDEEGMPIDGALVRLAVYTDGAYESPMVYGKLSGPGGYFHFGDLLPGPYKIEAFLPGKIPAAIVGFIQPGQLYEETLVLKPGSGGHAHGWVIDVDQNPVEHAVVQLRYIGTNIGVAAATNEDGYWMLDGIPYGACEISVFSAAYLPVSGSWDVYPNENQGPVAIVFPVPDYIPTGELSGTVKNMMGEPLEYGLVWLYNVQHPEFQFMALADETGEYYFPNPVIGTNAGLAFADGYEPDDGYVEIMEGELSELDFTLLPE